MNTTINVGIDISIRSTGICINHGDDLEFHVISPTDSIVDKKGNYRKWFAAIQNMATFHQYQSIQSHTTQLELLPTFNEIVDIIQRIFQDSNIYPHNCVITIEDYSYTKNNTNSIIDLVTLSTLIRNYLHINQYTIKLVSPTQLKVFCGSIAYKKQLTKTKGKYTYRNKQNKAAGSFDKTDMLAAIVESDIPNTHPYIGFLREYYNPNIKSVVKPLDDLNDAMLLSMYSLPK